MFLHDICNFSACLENYEYLTKLAKCWSIQTIVQEKLDQSVVLQRRVLAAKDDGILRVSFPYISRLWRRATDLK